MLKLVGHKTPVESDLAVGISPIKVHPLLANRSLLVAMQCGNPNNKQRRSYKLLKKTFL
jgi:hypothetical protein